MIIVEKKIAEHIPLTHIVKKDLHDQKLPLVIFLHGFESIKEKNIHYGYFLAEKGIRVVMPDALYHGERKEEMSPLELNMKFWEIIITSISELSLLKDFFVTNGLASEDKIGIAGTSMGGITTLGALTQYPWIKAAASLMGAPVTKKLAEHFIHQVTKNGVSLPISDDVLEKALNELNPFDITLQLEKLNHRPLLLWHGKKDETVPFSFTYDFYTSIRPLYKNVPERLQFVADERSGHKVSIAGVHHFVRWFEQYLLSE